MDAPLSGRQAIHGRWSDEAAVRAWTTCVNVTEVDAKRSLISLQKLRPDAMASFAAPHSAAPLFI
jgi:hypothetical protein